MTEQVAVSVIAGRRPIEISISWAAGHFPTRMAGRLSRQGAGKGGQDGAQPRRSDRKLIEIDIIITI